MVEDFGKSNNYPGHQTANYNELPLPHSSSHPPVIVTPPSPVSRPGSNRYIPVVWVLDTFQIYSLPSHPAIFLNLTLPRLSPPSPWQLLRCRQTTARASTALPYPPQTSRLPRHRASPCATPSPEASRMSAAATSVDLNPFCQEIIG